MDTFLIALAFIGVLSFFAGAWFFSLGSRTTNPDPIDYYNAGISLRMVFAGILSLTILAAALFPYQQSDRVDYLISYSFLLLSIIGLSLGFATLISPRAERFLGHLIRRTDSGRRAYILMAFFGLGAAFLFAFFLFYPPFISIG